MPVDPLPNDFHKYNLQDTPQNFGLIPCGYIGTRNAREVFQFYKDSKTGDLFMLLALVEQIKLLNCRCKLVPIDMEYVKLRCDDLLFHDFMRLSFRTYMGPHLKQIFIE